MAKITYEIDVKDNDLISTLEKSSKAVKKVDKQVNKLGDSASTSFDVFKGALGASFVTGAFAAIGVGLSKTVGKIGEFIAAANVQEDAVKRLNSALKNSGDFTEQASRDFQDFASAIQETTTFGDEAILNQLALAKSFGATNEQAKDIAKTATELSAAFGIDLESATRNVAKSLGGYAGELGEVIPELKNLTKEQLQAGQGIDLIASKFQGLAEAQKQTFSGATKSATNALGDLGEQLGFLITKNPLVVKAINFAGKVFMNLGNIVEANRTAIINYVNNFVKGLTFVIKPLTKYVGASLRLWGAIQRVITFAYEKTIKPVFDLIVDGYVQLADLIGEQLPGLFEKTSSKLADINEELGNIFTDNALSGYADTIEELGETMSDSLGGAFEEVEKKGKKLNVQLEKLDTNQMNVAKSAKTVQAPKQVTSKEKKDNTTSLLQRGAGSLVSSIGQGEAGAAGFLSNAGAMGAEAFLGPGTGQIVGPLLSNLFQDEKTVKGYIKGFTKAIPDIIENLIENIPVLIDALIDALPRLIEKLVEKLPPALVQMTLKLWERAITAPVKLMEGLFGKMIGNFVNGFKNAAGRLFQGVVNAGRGFFKFIIEGARNFIKKLLDGIRNALPKIGGGGKKSGGGLGVDLGFIKFAKGGQAFTKQVPTGFNNDTFPAQLTSGELVVDSSTSEKLKMFLDNVDKLFGSQNITIGLRPEAERVLTVEQNQSQALGLSRAF